MSSVVGADIARVFVNNPYRSQALSWYRRCIKAAFEIPWTSDEDALYVIEETRRLFNQNRCITDVERIERKLREVEMRYELGRHYLIPYPRPYHKLQGAMPESASAYSPYLDTAYDNGASPYTAFIQEGSSNAGVLGGIGSVSDVGEEISGTADVEGREQLNDTVVFPTSTLMEQRHHGFR